MRPIGKTTAWRWAIGIAAAVAALAATACTPIPRARTLPPTIQSVYIPMFANDTAEPGLEELATKATQEEFLADGRLRLEERLRADAFVECNIREFETETASREADDFPSFTRMRVLVDVIVRENYPTAPPLGGPRKVRAEVTYPSDIRRSIATLDVEARQSLMEDLARLIVREVLTGEYGEEAAAKKPTPTPKEKSVPFKL